MATAAGVVIIGVVLQVIAAANQPPPGELRSGPGSFADLVSAAGGAALLIGGLLFVYSLFKLGRALTRGE